MLNIILTKTIDPAYDEGITKRMFYGNIGEPMFETYGHGYVILDPTVTKSSDPDPTFKGAPIWSTDKPIDVRYHLFYVVPGPMEKLYLETGLDEAVTKGIITPEYRDEAFKKVITYKAFIAKFGK